MPAVPKRPNKAKIARRFVEVLDYFDDVHREATVMDIARRYGRPQSSTSELLLTLVELGLLHKDPTSRSFRPTPRAALLGAAGQRGIARDGRLVRLIDRLIAETGLSVAAFGRVGLNTQIVAWHTGARSSAGATRGLYSGLKDPLCNGAPGWLLLSTIEGAQREGALRRLNAEASEKGKFTVSEMSLLVHKCRDSGHARGKLGFGSQADVVAALLPVRGEVHPLVIGIIYHEEDRVSRNSLLSCLDEAIAQSLGHTAPNANVEKLPTAA